MLMQAPIARVPTAVGAVVHATAAIGVVTTYMYGHSSVPAALQEISEHWAGRLEIRESDALAFEIGQLSPPIKIVANLPYNIATPLLVGWLTGNPWPPNWQSLTLMFQREVAERIVAAAQGGGWPAQRGRSAQGILRRSTR